MSSSLAKKPFLHRGLPDVTIKGLGTALRTLPLFDTNKAFLRITDQDDRFSFNIERSSKASSSLIGSETSNLQTLTEASLFLVQYFNQPERPQILSSDDIWKSPVGDIALKCIQQASGSPLAGRVALGALRALPVSYGIFDNEAFRPPVGEEVLGLLQNMPFHPESGTKAEEILRQIQDLGGAEGWQSHTNELTVLWAKQQQIVSEEAENLARSVDTVPHSMISWQDLAADPLLHVLPLRVQAMPIICYLKNCSSADFIVQRPGRLSQYKHQHPSNNGPGTCFVAGTKIITKSGKKPIEDLEENDWVLTNGANDEWGLVSDERVVIPVDSPIIYGFNDEAPFFTAGHVFHTTTGFRALDAELAMKENPWAEVGRLSAGHILYRLGKDGRTYGQVPILGINWRQMPEVTEVYGVHLREGRGSYHANDYLVMVNYPEITLKRICSTLATFSQQDQVRLLQLLKELNPLFERFGIATVSEMVQREVDAAKNNLTARMYNVTENKLAGLAHASVCFNPEEIPTVDYSQLPYALPVVTLFDGVILVNGVVCEYGRVDNANSEVRWSRFISQNIVEHGVLSIQDPRYHSGIGRICYSTDYDGDDLLELPVFQYMTYGSECELEMDALSAGVTKQELIFKAASFEPLEDNIDGPIEVPDGEMMFKSFDMEEEKIATVDEIRASEVRGDSPQNLCSRGGYQIRSKAAGRVISDGNPGILFTDIAIPSLDTILALWNRKQSDETLKISRLYETATVMHNGRLKATVTIPPTTLENLKSLEDTKDAEDPSKTLTFKDELGEEAKLPLLFARLELNFSDDKSEIDSGILWEYNQDPSREGVEGVRHLITSRPGSASQRVPIRISQGQIVGEIPTGGPTGGQTTPQKEPIFQPPVGKSDLALQNLHAIFAKYNDDTVKTTSDQIFQNIMFYHMDQSHASLLSSKDKDTRQLPDHLGSNLPSNLFKWIKETFGPAYTCLQIAQSLQTREWRSNFTDDEKKRILYFWQGQGPRCLARCPENSTLNRLCLLEALKQLFPVLQNFINDGGEKWAQAYLDQLLNVKMDDIVEDMESNSRILDRYTTILWVLYPDGNYHERFRDAIYTKFLGFAMTQRVNKDAVMDWLPYMTKSFIDAILNESYEGIDKEVRDLLRKELDTFMAAHREIFEKNGKEFVAKNYADMVHILVWADLGLKSAMIIGMGSWRRVKFGNWDHLKGQSLLEVNLKSGWEGLGLAFKMTLLGFSIYNIVMGSKDMSAAQIGRVTTDNVRELVGQCQVINQTCGEKLPGYALGKAHDLDLQFDVRAADAKDFLELGKKRTSSETTWFGRMRGRLSLSSRVIRWLGIAISVVVVAFLIWELCNQWDHLSGTGKGLAIAQIAIETAAVIVGIIGLFSTCALIPVTGQVLMVIGLVVSIFYMVYGRPEPEKTPGEKFVDSMRGDNGWLKKIDDPPSTSLDYTITPIEIPKDADFSFKITGKNTESSSIEFISTPNAEKSASDTEILSINFGFTTGSDTVCLLSNESFSTAPDSKDGKCSYSGPDDIFQTKLHEPNGRVGGVTSYEYELQPLPQKDPTSTSRRFLPSGGSFSVIVSGKTRSSDKEFTLKLVEDRPGPVCAIKVQTFSRKK
ncbi:hypothetical protein FOIG_01838 [Fusarium odoratissimum NRRL 54006]|uniref:Uncharacterized protein n=1 Tax=Fusarium odoratissimum (strain NRRL 54006) TaxID=1089451 RepID=X0KJC5_FUSO5|nr:uncharacterized protein FOIG_01838 [Fusarium odoratissimum NRRL 54006]EXM08776.1 hypothetical protein FOIG_01838 [Fusarium odoratissimum NRRL 54006]